MTIGIDYNDQYCQACYFSERHGRPESVSGGTDVLRYLIPSVLCYDPAAQEWTIGNAALRIADNPGILVFRELFQHVFSGQTVRVEDREYNYTQLLAVYFGKLLEFIQIRTSVMGVDSITVTMKSVNRQIKETLEEVFEILKVPAGKVRLLSASESFGYYIMSEDPKLWQDGALMFDFSSGGFFVKQLNIRFDKDQPLVYINEYDFSGDFSVDHLASEVLRNQMDLKISNLYLDLIAKGNQSSVYFTGEGFDEQWFTATLNNISGSRRAFKGNNIYVKGACIAGHMNPDAGAFPIICKGRTRADISVLAWDNGEQTQILLSPAAVEWYDAGYLGDFILENEKQIQFQIHSIVSGADSSLGMDLSTFPERPPKTTRIQIEIRYSSEYECEILITDKGFGDFYPDRGTVVSRKFSLEGYI
ncbi:MAG: hypothetical protein IJ106_15960 [Parasporobacterium sp.]|nr:hypothetical protein [Parasporobacterium sp.]